MIYEHTVYICELEHTSSLTQCAAVWLEGDVIRTLKHLIHCDVENWFTGKTTCSVHRITTYKCQMLHSCLLSCSCSSNGGIQY